VNSPGHRSPITPVLIPWPQTHPVPEVTDDSTGELAALLRTRVDHLQTRTSLRYGLS
jgi:hypothetical protein